MTYEFKGNVFQGSDYTIENYTHALYLSQALRTQIISEHYYETKADAI